jgi:very-short-patch-repair endonuclease
LDNKIKNNDIYIGVGTRKEYFLKSEVNNIFFYDFTIKSKKIIIEFNGVAFHAKPEFLEKNEWFNPFTKENAHDNIEKSKIKYQVAKDKGFEVLEIWSDIDIIDNLDLCKKFIIDRI